MIKAIAISLMLASGGMSAAHDVLGVGTTLQDVKEGIAQIEAMTVEKDIFFMYGNEDGTYWIDPSAEYENVVYVGYDALVEWNVPEHIEHGTKVKGTFTSDGWELLGIEFEDDGMELVGL